MSNRPTHLAPGPEALWDWMTRRGLNQRETAKTLGLHYMSLNQFLLGHRKPGLANALLIERHTGIPAGIWVRTRVSVQKRRKADIGATANKQTGYQRAV